MKEVWWGKYENRLLLLTMRISHSRVHRHRATANESFFRLSHSRWKSWELIISYTQEYIICNICVIYVCNVWYHRSMAGQKSAWNKHFFFLSYMKPLNIKSSLTCTALDYFFVVIQLNSHSHHESITITSHTMAMINTWLMYPNPTPSYRV